MDSPTISSRPDVTVATTAPRVTPTPERGVFKKVVRPGDKVAAMAEFGDDGYFRGNRLASHVEIQFVGGPRDGETVFTGRTAGMFVPRGAGGY